MSPLSLFRRSSPARKAVRLLLGGGALGVLLASSGCAVWKLSESAALARRSEPYVQQPANPALRMLVVGDSTAVGTGASAPDRSVAGLIGRAHPRLAIENRATDGARAADVLQQLQRGGTFDLVLVQVGGNDVIRLTGAGSLQADLDSVAAQARRLSPKVVLMPCGNVGNAPFFYAPVSWWMTDRSRTLHRAVRAAAAAHGAVYVNLFHEREDDPFVRDPSLNASDGLHPGDRGYALWWQTLRTQGGIDGPLQAAR